MQPAANDRRPNGRVWIAAVALAAIAFAAFAPAIRYGFVNFDDPDYVSENKHVLSGLNVENVRWAFSTFATGYWQPVTWLSFQLDATLWGPRPWGFHLGNVVLHAANVALLYLTLRALTGAFMPGAAVALLFAVHPLRVESVAWVTERKDVLSTFFGLLALWAYSGYVAAPSVRRYLPVAAALTLSLMAKPMFVTFPFLLLVLDWWPLRRVLADWPAPEANPTESGVRAPTVAVGVANAHRTNNAGARSLARVWLPLVAEKIPLFVLVAGSSVVAYIAQSGAGLTRNYFPLWMRLENAAVSYVVYLSKMIWPVNLAVFYPHPGPTLPAWQVIGAVLLLAAVTGVAVVLRRRAPYLLAGWLWYVGTLVPVIGLVQVGDQAMADRFSYVPQIGILLALCMAVAEFAIIRGRLVVTMVLAASLVLAALTQRQLTFWGNSVDLWEHVNEVCGECSLAMIVLGKEMEKQERPEKAMSYYETGLRTDPYSFAALTALSSLLIRMERHDEAVPYLLTVCTIAPDYSLAHDQLGNCYFKQGKIDKAVSELAEYCRLDPNSARGYVDLGKVYLRQDNLPDGPRRAAECFARAVQVEPESQRAHMGLGLALARLGKKTEGVVQLRAAVQCEPGFAQAHALLGMALANSGDFQGAGDQLAEAVRLDPKTAEVWFSLGRVRHQQGLLEDAAECMRRAAALDPRFGPSASRAPTEARMP
jgi:protein O-mannosyl-transferase